MPIQNLGHADKNFQKAPFSCSYKSSHEDSSSNDDSDWDEDEDVYAYCSDPTSIESEVDVRIYSDEESDLEDQRPSTSSQVKEKIVKFDYKQHQAMAERYSKRTNDEESDNLCCFVTHGIDQEMSIICGRLTSLVFLIQNDIPGTKMLHHVHWVPYFATDLSFVPAAMEMGRKDNEHVMKQH